MRLLRFISEDELKILSSGKKIKAINSHEGRATTLGSLSLVYFLDIEEAYVYLKEMFPDLEESMLETEEIISFYDLTISGIVDNDYAVIVEKSNDECTIGSGTYAHPGYVYGIPGINIFDDIEIKEVGVNSYSLKDVKEIWENDGNDFFKKILWGKHINDAERKFR